MDGVLVVLLAVVLLVAVSVLLYQARTGVPAMSSNSEEAADVAGLLKRAGVPEQAIIYELGSGWGKIVIALADAFPKAQIRGIELSPFPYLIARLRTRNRPNVRLLRRNFYDCDLRDADAVTCYLMMKPMPKLAAFLDTMLRPGTPVVSLTFWFRGREVAEKRNGPGLRGEAALYYWPGKLPE